MLTALTPVLSELARPHAHWNTTQTAEGHYKATASSNAGSLCTRHCHSCDSTVGACHTLGLPGCDLVHFIVVILQAAFVINLLRA